MFYTGDGLSAKVVRYCIDILDEGWIIESFIGALNYLGVESNWVELGTVTPFEASERSNDALVTFRRDTLSIGSIIPYATAGAPVDTLPCDGSSHLRVDYPELYAILDTPFIVDADNFVTPDLRGRTVIGMGTGTGLTARAMADSVGEESHVLIEGELAAHSHTNSPHTHTYNHVIVNIDVESVGVPDPTGVGQPLFSANTGASAVAIDNTGSDEPHNTMQPSYALRYCIAAR